MTSPTVSSESVARQERGDPCGIDPYPAAVSSKHVERQERRDPCHSDIPEWLQEFRENLVDDRVPEHRDSHASSSHEPSLEPMRSVDLGKHSFHTHFPKDRKLRDLPEDQNHKGSVQKTYWHSRTSCRKFW